VNDSIAPVHSSSQAVDIPNIANVTLKGNHVDAMRLARLTNQATDLVPLRMQ